MLQQQKRPVRQDSFLFLDRSQLQRKQQRRRRLYPDHRTETVADQEILSRFGEEGRDLHADLHAHKPRRCGRADRACLRRHPAGRPGARRHAGSFPVRRQCFRNRRQQNQLQRGQTCGRAEQLYRHGASDDGRNTGAGHLRQAAPACRDRFEVRPCSAQRRIDVRQTRGASDGDNV